MVASHRGERHQGAWISSPSLLLGFSIGKISIFLLIVLLRDAQAGSTLKRVSAESPQEVLRRGHLCWRSHVPERLTLTVTPWVTHESARIATPRLHYDFWEVKVSYVIDVLVSKL